jgi:hypothetical protein
VFLRDARAAKEDRAWLPRTPRPGRDTFVKARIVRILVALSSVAMIALAGGASLRGF